MGDTGSLAIGGLVGIIALMIHQPLTLIIVGGIFVMEAGSVILQVASFKTRGKESFGCHPYIIILNSKAGKKPRSSFVFGYFRFFSLF